MIVLIGLFRIPIQTAAKTAELRKGKWPVIFG